MSLATRRSASARWSRWATSSARWAPLTIAPIASAATRATSRSRGPSEPGGLADDEQDAPRLARPGDRHGQLGPVVGQDGERRRRRRRRRAGCRASAPRAGPVPTGGQARGSCRGSRSDAGRSTRRSGPATSRAGDGARCEPIAAGLPDRDEVMAVRIAERLDRGGERLVGVVVGVDQAGRCVEATARSRWWRSASSGSADRLVDAGRCGAEPRGRGAGRSLRRPPHVPVATGAAAVGRPGLGGGQEALEVTEAVASIASRVDPVVAQPAGVAPGPDRVRVHAEQPGGLGDRQGRVRGSGREGGWHGSLRKCEVDRAEPTNLTVLANRPMVPAAFTVSRRAVSRT